MGRVSLTEDYDDRSVIAKLNEMDKRVTENTTVVTSAEASAKASAQAAQETADRFAGSVGAVVQNANAQINASKAQVDSAKAEVDAAVTTMATYDTRLTAVEDADTHNVKLEGNQTITGVKTVPTEATGTKSQQIANSTKIGAELDNYAPMVRTTGSQYIYGRKAFETPVCEGTKDTFREYVKFTDVVREEASNRRCYISSVLDSNERGLVTTEVGMDDSGKRAYYAIGFGGIVVNGNFLSGQLRVNLTETGVSLQLFDPINRVWKTAVFQ